MSSYYSIIIKITILSSFISKENSYTNKILRSYRNLNNTDYISIRKLILRDILKNA